MTISGRIDRIAMSKFIHLTGICLRIRRKIETLLLFSVFFQINICIVIIANQNAKIYLHIYDFLYRAFDFLDEWSRKSSSITRS